MTRKFDEQKTKDILSAFRQDIYSAIYYHEFVRTLQEADPIIQKYSEEGPTFYSISSSDIRKILQEGLVGNIYRSFIDMYILSVCRLLDNQADCRTLYLIDKGGSELIYKNNQSFIKPLEQYRNERVGHFLDQNTDLNKIYQVPIGKDFFKLTKELNSLRNNIASEFNTTFPIIGDLDTNLNIKTVESQGREAASALIINIYFGNKGFEEKKDVFLLEIKDHIKRSRP